MWQDARRALRGLRRAPVFSCVAIVTLTLAIGANTAIFSLLDALILRTLPVPDPQTLVQIATYRRGSSYEAGLTFPMYREIQRRQHVFSSVIGWFGSGVYAIDTDREQTRGACWLVSGDFYQELGARPIRGRLLNPQDVNESAADPARVAVVSYRFWQLRYNGADGIIGQRVRVEGHPFTIVGVAPPGFRGPSLTVEPDVTLPFTAYPVITDAPPSVLRDGTSFWVRTMARLKPGVSLKQARAELETLWPDLKMSTAPPQYGGAQRVRFLDTQLAVKTGATGIEPGLRSRFTQPLLVVLGIAALTLMIACVNLASLMLSRAAARAHDTGIRVALGSGRWATIRPVLIENLILALAGAVGGVSLGYEISSSLAASILRDYEMPASLDVTPDGVVVAFVLVLVVLVTLLCSVGSGWLASRVDVAQLLRRSTRTTTGTGSVGAVLVSTQVCLSLILLTNAGLLVRTLQAIRDVPSGLRTEDVVVAYPSPRPGGYAHVDNDTYYPGVMERIRALPGVRAAAVSLFKPGSGGGNPEPVSRAEAAPGSAGDAAFMASSPGLFDTLGIALRSGRDFAWSDNSSGQRVAIVSEALARRLAQNGAVVGRRIRVGVSPTQQELQVVGVVADSHLYDLRDSNTAAVYVSALQEPDNSYKCFVVHASALSVGDLNKVLGAFGYEQVTELQSLVYITDRALLTQRLSAALATFFGGLALLLAGVGLYGLMSYAVARRRREIGVRLALGADGRRIVRTILADGLKVALVGAGTGLCAALVTVRLVKSLLFGVTTHDTVTLLGAPAVLILVALAACVVPAVSAARTDPMIALRGE